MPESDSVAELLLNDWEEDRVWFRDFIPDDLPWGDVELLEEVPPKAEGYYGIKFASNTSVGEKRFEAGEIAVCANREDFSELFAGSGNIEGIVVPWYDRIIPATLLKPFQRQIDGQEYKRGLAMRFWKAVGMTVLLVGGGYLLSLRLYPEIIFLAVIGAIYFGLFPMVEVALTYFRKVGDIPVEELNRRVVNSEFFRRWIFSRSTTYLKIALGVLIVIFAAQMKIDSDYLKNLPRNEVPVSLPSIEEAALVRADTEVPTIQNGEWWRLVTTGLMHGSVPHILFNGMALYSIGRIIAALVTPHLLSFVFLFSVVTGSLASLFFGLDPGRASVGASGGILGCLGFLLVITYKYKGKIPGFLRLSLIQSIIVISLIGVIGSSIIDNFAHGGGFLGGVLLGVGFFPRLSLAPLKPRPEIRILGWASIVILLAGVGKIGVELAQLW